MHDSAASPVVSCNHRSGDNICPISKSPCPGICIYEQILANVKIGILVFDLVEKSITFKNTEADRILDDLCPTKEYELLHDKLFPDLGQVATDVLPHSHSIKHGHRIYGFTGYHISSNFLWIFVKDVTENERLLAVAEAVETMNNVGYIFSGIRHEIGNPINSLKMTMSVLKRNYDDFPREMVMAYIDRAMGEVVRVEYLLRSLKNFNMFEAPKIESASLAKFFHDFAALVADDFEKRGVTLVVEADPDAPSALFDPRALQQVLLNLTSNAADALEGCADRRITISATPAAGMVHIHVSDNGPGISPRQQAVLFKPFSTTKENGTGLGLVIAKKMMTKMNGTIEIESELGLGTTVILSLPAGTV